MNKERNPRKAQRPGQKVWREVGWIVSQGGAVAVERRGNVTRVRTAVV